MDEQSDEDDEDGIEEDLEFREGVSLYDIRKHLEFFYPPPALSAFGTDLYPKIHAISLSPSAFPWPQVWTSYIEAPI